MPYQTPVVSNIKKHSLDLSWEPARFPGRALKTPVYYIVEVQEPPVYDWRPLVHRLNDTHYTVHNMLPDKEYMYRIRAENDYGMSEPTLPVSTAHLRKKGKCGNKSESWCHS